MRRSLVAVVAALSVLAAAGPAGAPVRAADGSAPKVVIVVGATHSATARYRSYADAAYAEAIRHTPNVVKVYSPKATWSKVKAAAKGASVLIYFGHGNGWPSPYTYDPEYRTKDGFGLNYDNNGDGKLSDYENRYYGEPYVRTLELTEGAIVMLHHLCYASGNSEPGHAEPSLSTARKRIDNYGAGFLAGRAGVVLADGHRGPVDYLRALFTTNQTIESLWRKAPNANGHVSSFSSTRTPGARAFMDPETSTSGFYRSLVGDTKLTTLEIRGGFTVPGRAAVKTAGASLFSAWPFPTDETGAPAPAAVLPADTRLKLLRTASGSGDAAVFEVEGLDDPSIVGFVAARDLEPRDSTPPTLVSVSGAGAAYSTAATGGQHRLGGRFSEGVDWRVRIVRGETVHVERTGSGTTFEVAWDPEADGAGDGAYDYDIRAFDTWVNGPLTADGGFVIDTTPPSGSASADGGADSAVVGTVRVATAATDALSDVTDIRLSNGPEVDDEGVLVDGVTYGYDDTTVWTLAPGRGTRTVHVQWRDAAGNWSDVASDAIVVDPPDTTYHPVPPVRLLDTRIDLPAGATRLAANRPMTFAVAGRGDIPADAVAVSGNLTVVGGTAGGYVSLGPIVGPRPSTSTINMERGDTRANGVVVALDRNGDLEAVFRAASGSRTDLLFDVTGYFTADGGGAGFTSVAPTRFLDTRVASGSTGGLPLTSGVPLAIEVAGAANGVIPSDALAITGNLTVVPGDASGYLALTPNAESEPTTSSLNFPARDVRANNVTVPVGPGGPVHVVYRGSGTAHAILDVTGYYAEGEGSAWVPLAPARVLDSRVGVGRSEPFEANVPGAVTVRGAVGVGDDAAALSGNLTATRFTRGGYVSLTPTPEAAPTTSTINARAGDTLANGVVSRIDPATGRVGLTYKASGGATVELILDITGYFH